MCKESNPGSLIYISRPKFSLSSPFQMPAESGQSRSVCQSPVSLVTLAVLFPPFVRAIATVPWQTRGCRGARESKRSEDRGRAATSYYHGGDGEALLKRSREELPCPRVRGIKIEIQIGTTGEITVSLISACTLTGEEEASVSIRGVGRVPSPVSIPSVHFRSSTPTASASSTRHPIPSRFSTLSSRR